MHLSPAEKACLVTHGMVSIRAVNLLQALSCSLVTDFCLSHIEHEDISRICSVMRTKAFDDNLQPHLLHEDWVQMSL